MPNFAANLSFLYPDLPFLDRFAAAARDGFDAVEFLFPYAFDARDVKARLRDHGLKQVLFNVSPGDWDGGERGLAARPGHEARFRAAVEEALAYAQVLGCPRLHVMAGLKEPDTARQHATYRENLAWAASLAAPDRPTALLVQGTSILVETLNAVSAAGLSMPRDLSLMSIGDPDFAVHHAPPLTALRVDLHAVADRTAERLLARLGGETTEAVSLRVPSELIERGSCGPAP